MDRTSTASPQSQLRPGLSRNGLPRGPASSETSSTTTTTTLSIRPHRTNSTSSNLDTSKTTFYHVSEAPLSPPITPFSPSAFPSDYTSPTAIQPHEYHHNQRQTSNPEHHCRHRRRSLQDIPQAQPDAQRHEAPRELSPPPDDEEQTHQTLSQQQQPSPFARMAKKLKSLSSSSSSSSKKSGDKKAKEAVPFKSAAQRAQEFEEMEDVHWTEM